MGPFTGHWLVAAGTFSSQKPLLVQTHVQMPKKHLGARQIQIPSQGAKRLLMVTKMKGSIFPGALGPGEGEQELLRSEGKRRQGTSRALCQGATTHCKPHSQGENVLRTHSSSMVLDLKAGDGSPSSCWCWGQQQGCCPPVAGDLRPCNLN